MIACLLERLIWILQVMKNDILVSFIIVNYESRNYLLRCIESICQKKMGFSYEIIVVNNDIIPLEFNFEIKHLSILEENKNLGFATSCNIGAKMAKGIIFCFLNPDTELLASQDILPLTTLLIQKRFAVIGPKLIPDPSSSDPQEWSTGAKTGIWDIIKNNLGLATSKKIWQSKELIRVDWVSGACLFVRRDNFFEVNGFDENFFMYFEDMDFCTRIRSKGKKIAYFPKYSVVHFSGKSNSSRSLQKKYYFQSQGYYLKKHSGKLAYFFISIAHRLRIE